MRRVVRLTNLIPEVLDMADEKKIAFNPAVELSNLKPREQKNFLEAMDYAQASPSLSQAQRMKKLSQAGDCTLDAMCDVMDEVKKDDMGQIAFKTSELQRYFPKSYTHKQMSDSIIRLLEQYQWDNYQFAQGSCYPRLRNRQLRRKRIWVMSLLILTVIFISP